MASDLADHCRGRAPQLHRHGLGGHGRASGAAGGPSATAKCLMRQPHSRSQRHLDLHLHLDGPGGCTHAESHGQSHGQPIAIPNPHTNPKPDAISNNPDAIPSDHHTVTYSSANHNDTKTNVKPERLHQRSWSLRLP